MKKKIERRDESGAGYFNRPITADATNRLDVPTPPEDPPRAPEDPPDVDGVQGDEGGGESPRWRGPGRRRRGWSRS